MSKMYTVGLLTALAVVNARPQISLEYKPMRPFYHPRPSGTYPSQIVPPAKPWPDSANGYQNFSQVPTIVDRIKETQSENKPSSSSGFLWPSDTDKQVDVTKPPELPTTTKRITLEYQPTRPPFHPKPGDNIQPIVPPGKPWPDRPEDYEMSYAPDIVDRIKEESLQTNTPATQQQTPISLEYKPTRPFFHPNPGNNIHQIVPPGKPWPSSAEGYQNFSQMGSSPDLENRIKDTTPANIFTTTKKQELVISLEYQPNRPPFHPNPGNNINQIIPPGEPWPSSVEGYQNFSQIGSSPDLENRIKDTTPANTFTTTKKQELVISLEYQPNRPPFHPNPGNNINQIIPPGEPWPDSPEGYQNFSQVGSYPHLVNRGQETNSFSTERSNTQTTNSNKVQQPISLEYQPNRPFFHPNPGNKINQIIPPGKPWPDSPEGYQNFSQSSQVLTVQNRVKDTEESTTTRQNSTTIGTQTPTSLEYKPTKPFDHPHSSDTLKETVPTTTSNNKIQPTPLPDLISVLKDFVDKKKAMEKTIKSTESNFVWNGNQSSETNSTQNEQPEPKATHYTKHSEESSVGEINSPETSTTDADISAVTAGILSEELLYTSAPMKIIHNEDKIT